MAHSTGPGTIIGQARIIAYEVGFDGVTYVIAVRECLQEHPARFEEIPDFQIETHLPFNSYDSEALVKWLQNPAFVAIRDSWKANEESCYFEYDSSERAAFMIVNGVGMRIPIAALPPEFQKNQ